MLNKLFVALRSLRNENRASVAIYFALALFPILMMVGAAVDYGRALRAQRDLQAAVDEAAIAVVQASSTSQTLAYNKTFDNLGSLASSINLNVPAPTAPTSTKKYYEVTATGSVPTAFLSIAGTSHIPIAAKAGAQTITNGNGNGCVLSLDSSAVDAFWDNGNSTVSLNGCDIYDNSANGAALVVGGSASLVARQVNVVGGVAGTSQITASAGINTGVSPTQDPYNPSLQIPSYTATCDANHTGFSTKTAVTLNPGVYCDGFQANSTAVVTLSPGLYIFNRGAFQINGSATLTSTGGVTLIFTSSTGSNWPTVTINGGATVTLAAPTTTEITNGNSGLNGILMFADRSMPVGTQYKLNGGSNQTLSGAIYLPEAAVNYSGNTAASSPCLQLIGDTIDFQGTSNVAITSCGNYNLKYYGTPINGSTVNVKLVE